MGNRKPISPDVVVDITSESRRRCCICFALSKMATKRRGRLNVLIGMLRITRRRILCSCVLIIMNEYDSRTRQAKGLTSEEVKRYKVELLA